MLLAAMLLLVAQAAARLGEHAPTRKLVLVANIMIWERCYLTEWLAYHFALGVSRVYALPVFGVSAINHAHQQPEPTNATLDEAEQMRNFSTHDPRVEVLCLVHGGPGRCSDPNATSYQFRGTTAALLAEHIAPRHAGDWIMVLDMDE